MGFGPSEISCKKPMAAVWPITERVKRLGFFERKNQKMHFPPKKRLNRKTTGTISQVLKIFGAISVPFPW
jgi:hypothetical protein